MSRTDTIVALATAPGKAAVGILRLSGPRALEIAARLAPPPAPPRRAALRKFHDTEGEALDQGLVLCFHSPHSFTGEDAAELQGHGGPVVLDLLLRAACAAGARLARPGEFSERAFLNGRLDLAQAEAIAGLIEAGSAQAARAAQRSLEGQFSRAVQHRLEALIQLRVHVEGALDFSDEEVDWLADEGLRQGLQDLAAGLAHLLAQARSGQRLREGLVIALAGPPNAGKSTLMNRLAGAEVAIVTDIPGTTRDLLRENLDLDGLPLTLVDTAGLRLSHDPIEQEGIRRAQDAIRKAELTLYLSDDSRQWTEEDEQQIAGLGAAEVWVLRSKCDLSGHSPGGRQQGGRKHLRLSAHTGAGMDLLKREILAYAGLSTTTEGLFSARTRHLEALRRAHGHVTEAQRRLSQADQVELCAEELRQAQQALGEITGVFTSEDLLGRVFAQFCIGK